MTKTPSVTSQVREALGHSVDTLGKTKSGTFRVRKGYFYRHGMDAQSFCSRVSEKLKAAGIAHRVEDSGDHFASFKGGKGVAANSHFYAEFTVFA